MKIAGWAGPGGSAFWRIVDPFKYLTKRGHEAYYITDKITEKVAQWADVYVLNGVVDKEGIALLHAYQKERGKKLVIDMDDRVEIEPDNPHMMEHTVSHAPEIVKIALAASDMVTTTSEHLADKLRAYNDNVVILPNYMDLERWDLSKLKNTSDRVRIGWAGSITHLEDIKLIVEPLQRIKEKYPHVDIIMVGDARTRQLFGDTPIETVPGVPFEFWPSRLHGLRLDIGLAPLQDTDFNQCKSDIKWQEYAIAKIAGVYSPVVYKRGMLATTPDEWFYQIERLLDPSFRRRYVEDNYRTALTEYALPAYIHKWEQAYRSL